MFICSELIEETGKHTGLLLACGDFFFQVRVLENFSDI